jgi:UDP-N-acetylmuramyl pentapeptide phosphotransferase/UDP-N-acetylglucosamine-1-phosphate transferase
MRFLGNPTVRGLAIVAAVSVAIVALSLEASLAVVGGILWIVFLIAIVVFVVRLARRRRDVVDHWSTRGRIVLAAAVALAVIDVAAAVLLSPTRGDAVAFFVVLALSVLVALRTWRDEQRLA